MVISRLSYLEITVLQTQTSPSLWWFHFSIDLWCDLWAWSCAQPDFRHSGVVNTASRLVEVSTHKGNDLNSKVKIMKVILKWKVKNV